MAQNNNTPSLDTVAQELAELKSRLNWLDEERRKATRRVAELDQRLISQERKVEKREQRIQELESQLANSRSQMVQLDGMDGKLQQMRDEIVSMLEQYDQRRILAGEEGERMRRVEHEVMARELADIRKELPAIGRLKDQMDLRQAEDSRLANLIATLQSRVTSIDGRVETWTSDLSFIEESGRNVQRTLTEFETAILEINKRWEPINNRLDILGNSVLKAEKKVAGVNDIQSEVHKTLKQWTEKVQIGEYERTQRVEEWRREIEAQNEKLERFSQEWIGYADQYKESKMALQTLTEFQRQLEQQQREVSEVVRVETTRMQARWDTFLHENEQRWKTAEVDGEQHWSVARRDHKKLSDQLLEMEELLTQIEQDKDTLWRVQTAQADAIKSLPRIWLEEIEKAVTQNPNRRRQPALVPVREE